MTKRAIVGKALAIAIAIGVDATTQGVKRKLEPTSNSDNDQLLEYFGTMESGESSVSESEDIQESWLPNPSIHIKESIWKDLDNKNNNKNKNNTSSSSSSTHRRRTFDTEDEDWWEAENDDPVQGYSNYDQEEMQEHYEELITEDDDDGGSIFRIDDDDIFDFIGAQTTMPPTLDFPPTASPTFIGSSFWDALDEYEQWDDDEVSSSDSRDDEDYAHNTICLRISLGVVHYQNMSEEEAMEMIHMALRTMTKVLNEQTDIPFEVHDRIDEYHHRELLTVDFGTQVGVGERPQKVEPLHLADLILENVVVDSGDHNWWVVSAIFTVWKRPHGNSFMARGDDHEKGDYHDKHGRDQDDQHYDHKKGHTNRKLEQNRRKLGIPVKNQSILSTIEGICRYALEQSIQDGTYWNALHTIEYGNHALVLDKNLFYADEKGMIDAQPVGDEYDMSRGFCPIDRPQYGETTVCPEDVNTALVEDQWPPYFSDEMFGVPTNADSNIIRDGTSDATFPRVIAESLSDIEWGDREWTGLALLISTIVWTILLSVTAHFVYQKRKTQILWGTPLTSSGVDDILKVGWRVYEQPQPQAPQQPPQVPPDQLSAENLQEQIQPPQLFLQIYDKGQGIGYNDENSLLKGGVEQQVFAPPAPETPSR